MTREERIDSLAHRLRRLTTRLVRESGSNLNLQKYNLKYFREEAKYMVEEE